MKGDYEDRHICDIVTDKEKAKKLKEFYSYFSQCSDNSWTPDSEEAYIEFSLLWQILLCF